MQSFVRFTRSFRVLSTAVVVVAVASASMIAAHADQNDPQAWIINQIAPQTTYPLGQTAFEFQIDNSDGTQAPADGQASLSEENSGGGETLLATAQAGNGGIVDFPSSDFASAPTALSQGSHSLIVRYGDTSTTFDITVTNGQTWGEFTNVIDNGNGTANFNYALHEIGNTEPNVFPTAVIGVAENSNYSSLLALLPTPQFLNGATTVTGSFNSVPFDTSQTYELYFRGDNNFDLDVGVEYATTSTVATHIAFNNALTGEGGIDPVDATITADDGGSIGGQATLTDNGTVVETTSLTGGNAIAFNYAPETGSHNLVISYNGKAPFKPSTQSLTRNYSGPPATVLSTTTSTSTSTSSSTTTSPLRTAPVEPSQTQTASGYRLVSADGKVTAFGGVSTYGDISGLHLNAPIIAAIDTADDKGYWLLASDGGIFSFGDARFYGSMGGQHLNAPVVGITPTSTGLGYWLVASDGGIFAYGDAEFYGSMGGQHLNAPVVGITAGVGDHGYRMVATDGGIFSFGSAQFYGSMGGQHLNAPVVGMAPTQSGNGYWFVASDGGVFSYGDAVFQGSTGSLRLNKPIVSILATKTGGGYWFVASDGGVFNYGDAPFYGSLGYSGQSAPIVALA